MTKEIKFRGVKKDGSFAYGNLLSESAIGKWGNSEYYSYAEVDKNTVGQRSNWLSNKAGKDVYEGDIIAHDLHEGMGMPYTTGHRHIVTSIESNYGYYTNVRVIGNIHENPELI